MMGFDNLARAALIAAIPTLYALGWLRLWHVLVLASLAGALSPATTAGVRAFVPHLVDAAALDRANAHLQYALYRTTSENVRCCS
jgi:hypothetical protein